MSLDTRTLSQGYMTSGRSTNAECKDRVWKKALGLKRKEVKMERTLQNEYLIKVNETVALKVCILTV